MSVDSRFASSTCVYIRVELLGEDEVGGGAGDGDESADGRGVGDAERQAFTDHVIPLGGILGVSPGAHPLHVRDLDGKLTMRRRKRSNISHLVSAGS